MYSPNPPSVFIPKSYPVIKTSSPFMKSGTLESSTIPAASIPGVWGYSLVTPLFPIQDKASL